MVVVDAIQSLGALAHDVHAEGIHALVAGGHKWLQAPLGAGLLYVSRALRERLTPPEVGWKSVTNDTDFSIHFDLKPEARMFEAGTPNVAGVAGLRASLQLLLEVGPATIEARIQATTAALADLARAHGWEVVSPWGPDERSGILSLVPTVPLEPLHDHLQASGVRCSVRGGRLRLSPHWYNNAVDVQRFARALDACPVS